MDEMLLALNKYPNGTYIIVEWDEAQVMLGGLIETIYQTNNSLPVDAPSYQEYYAVVFRLKDIMRNHGSSTYKPNMVMELSMLTKPDRVKTENGMLIWQAKA